MVLGIGSTTAAVQRDERHWPLPFPESSRVVQLNGVVNGQVIGTLAYPDLMDFRRTVPDFADVTVYSTSDQTLQSGTDPQLVHMVQVDESYPKVFGTRIALGRWLTSADRVVNGPGVVILSNAFWMREFGGDRGMVGRTIMLDNQPVQVIGVLAPQAYTFPDPDADALRPLVVTPNTPQTNRGSLWAQASARLTPGATIAGASSHIASAAKLLATNFPESNTKLSAHITPLRDAVVGGVQSMLQLLAVAVGVVLLIACANIANLILGRAHSRAREFAVRSALGGSPGRVRGQVFTESLMLAVIGGVLGVHRTGADARAGRSVSHAPRRGNRGRRARDGRCRARDDRGRRACGAAHGAPCRAPRPRR